MNKQDLIIEMSNHPYIKEFMTKRDLPVSDIIDHYNVFLSTYESLLKCRNCQGLYCCGQKKTGEVMTLNYDVSYYNDITYCKYYLNKLKQDKLNNSFVRSDIPKEYQSLTLDNISLLDANIENLCVYMYEILDEKRDKGLYIYGNLGVGKTYMCMALANSMVKKGKKTAFLKTNFFVNEMRKLVASNNQEYEAVIESIKKCDCLIMDDIGSESVSSYSRDDLLFNILDYRMENKLITVFTSNLSKDSLLKHYTYDKNDNSSIIRSRRLLERIDILSDNFVLEGDNKRRSK
ncbi:MAG: ATP-binding protein [Erysipelotrichaceae bacterium]|nr:ATP-binding protein [Erysipelotrichaceae bacterium]